MRWILIIAGVLSAIVLAVTLTGMALPQNHVAQRTTRLSAPPERIWSLITDVSSYPSWRSDVKSVEILPSAGGHAAWREVSGRDKISYEATTSDAPLHFVTLFTDKGLPFGGSWDYRLAPEASGTRITITENGEVYNPVSASFRDTLWATLPRSTSISGASQSGRGILMFLKGKSDWWRGVVHAFSPLSDMLSECWSPRGQHSAIHALTQAPNPT